MGKNKNVEEVKDDVQFEAEILEVAPVEDEVVVESPVETPVEDSKEDDHIQRLVKEVVKGMHGTGRERMLSLGDDYEAVQHEVNQLIKKGEI